MREVGRRVRGALGLVFGVLSLSRFGVLGGATVLAFQRRADEPPQLAGEVPLQLE